MKAIKNYSVIYQDESIVVLNKVSGLLVASDRYDKEAPRLDKLAEEEFGRLLAVHRIDKDTSGLVIYARTPEAHRFLSIAFERREVHKTYHALVHGRPAWEEYTHKAKLLPDGDPRHRTVVNKRMGKESITNFKLLGTVGPYSWIQADPVTGRTHQIRAHMAYIGHPLLGDEKYGDKALNKRFHQNHQLLCSYKLMFDFSEDAGELQYLNQKEFSLSEIWFCDNNKIKL